MDDDKRKRPNGTGSVVPVGDGTDRHRILVVTNGRRRQLGPIHPDRETAERFLKAHNVARMVGQVEQNQAITLAKLGAEWLDVREVHGSEKDAETVRSIDSERSYWSNHVAPSALSKKAIKNITAKDGLEYMAWLRARPKVKAVRQGKGYITREVGGTISSQAQRHAWRLVKQLLDYAITQGVIAVNPFAALSGPRVKSNPSDWLRPEEIVKLLSCEKIDMRSRTFYAVAIATGLRLNDITGIELANVRLGSVRPGPHMLVNIRKADGKLVMIPILPWLAPWIEAHIKTLPKGTKWLFPQGDGHRYSLKSNEDFGWSEQRAHKTVDGKKVLSRTPGALEIAGIKRKVKFHGLRATAGTCLAIGAWGPVYGPVEIQRHLAHSDLKSTEKYIRAADEYLSTRAQTLTNGPAFPVPVAPVVAAGESAPVVVAAPALRVPAASPRCNEGQDQIADSQAFEDPAVAPGCTVSFGANPSNPAESLYEPRRTRTSDLRLRSLASSPVIPEGYGISVQPMFNRAEGAQESYSARDAALSVLAAVTGGTVTQEAIDRLAVSVLSSAPASVQLAATVLRTAQDGPGVDLATATLASAPEAYRLALRVQEGGPMAQRLAIELAALVLSGGMQ